MSQPLLNSTNAASLERLRQIGPGGPPIPSGQHLAFSGDGQWLVSVEQKGLGRMRGWKLSERNESPAFCLPVKNELSAVVPVGADRVLSATHGGLLQERSAADGVLRREHHQTTGASGLALGSDGRTLLIAGGDGDTSLWDVEQGVPVRDLEKRPRRLYGCALSPDGRLAAAGAGHLGQSSPGGILIWDVATGSLVREVAVEAFWAWSVAFHPSEPLLVAGAPSNNIFVVDTTRWQVVRKLEALGTEHVCFSPDGALLVGGGTGFSVLDFHGGSILHEHSDDNDMQSSPAVFSPDGRFIAWGQGDGTVGLWGVRDEE